MGRYGRAQNAEGELDPDVFPTRGALDPRPRPTRQGPEKMRAKGLGLSSEFENLLQSET